MNKKEVIQETLKERTRKVENAFRKSVENAITSISQRQSELEWAEKNLVNAKQALLALKYIPPSELELEGFDE